MNRLLIVFISLLLFLFACSENEEEPNVDSSELEATTEEKEPSESDTMDEKEEEIVAENDTKTEEVKEPLYEIAEDATVIPIEEGTNEKVVLLTIDDIPDQHALEMAKKLKALDAGAIFFANGHFLETDEQKNMLKEIHEMGFAIGNHTYTHPVLTDISEEEQYEEIISVSDKIEEIIGERPRFFRAPHGVNSDYSISVAEDDGMVVMNWTYGYDYFEGYMDAEKLAHAMVTGEGPEAGVDYSLLKSGANLLMHDREWTKEALEDIVTGLRESGYEIVDPKLIKVDN